MKSGSGNRFLRFLPGLLLSLLAFLAILWSVDWQATMVAWRGAQLWVLVPALALVVGAMLTRAMGWRTLMGNTVPPGKCFWVLNISYLLNGILPFRLGDIARAYLISRREETPPPVTAGAALSAVALERMFDLIFTFVLVLSVFPMIAGGEWSSKVLLYTFGIALAGFLALFLVGSVSARIMQLAQRVAIRFPLVRPVLGPLDHFLTGLKKVRNLRTSAPAFAWIGVTLLLWAAEYWVVLTGFFPGAPLYWGLLSLIGGLIGVMLPSSPSSLGVFEGAVAIVLTMAGMARDPVVAFAIAIHMLNILSLMTLGVIGLLMERQSLGSILSMTRAAEKA